MNADNVKTKILIGVRIYRRSSNSSQFHTPFLGFSLLRLDFILDLESVLYDELGKIGHRRDPCRAVPDEIPIDLDRLCTPKFKFCGG